MQQYKSAVVKPVLYGFGDHQPVCMITSGRVPAGMVFGSDCSIAGRPTESTVARFTVRVGASGVSNTILTGSSITVNGPSIAYAVTGTSDVGLIVNDPIQLGTWTPDGRPATWTFTLKSGTLPPGLTLSSTSGTISGTLNTTGTYSAVIQGTATTEFGTVDKTATYARNVGIPGFGYLNTGGTGRTSTSSQAAYISQDFSAEPYGDIGTPAGSTFGNFTLPGAQLPAGLVLDPNTGKITGSPTATTAAFGITIPVKATVTSNGITNPTQGSFNIEVNYPFGIRNSLDSTPRALGVPLNIVPTVTTISPVPLISPSVGNYTPIAGQCSLPAGVSIDSSSGAATGTPTVAGSFSCWINATLSNNGKSWTQSMQLFLVTR
ncbi:putative Ig domain-containing protein [Variovorax sp. Sphag1AA]|uniref:putative Ig domain-containing protein n=1 Tax=Variovorax sp. Sphag1AA TaxID=2587027 RepID=UPI0016182746|nr:putative Ig domain-containing protein [Variovorax sp. Sphag1AA]MBB3178009.1 hypothetical protein [Variovorax sp. Sphag1AA]